MCTFFRGSETSQNRCLYAHLPRGHLHSNRSLLIASLCSPVKEADDSTHLPQTSSPSKRLCFHLLYHPSHQHSRFFSFLYPTPTSSHLLNPVSSSFVVLSAFPVYSLLSQPLQLLTLLLDFTGAFSLVSLNSTFPLHITLYVASNIILLFQSSVSLALLRTFRGSPCLRALPSKPPWLTVKGFP